jgi:hypothetical protein
MLYRLLRPGENWLLGLWAKNRTSDVSVFIHVIKGSSREYDSIYISTFGSLNAMLNFRSKSMTPGAQMVQIVEDNLPVIDGGCLNKIALPISFIASILKLCALIQGYCLLKDLNYVGNRTGTKLLFL